MNKLENLLQRAKRLKSPAPFRVYFKDGTEKTLHAADIIPILVDDSDRIKRIEHDETDSKNGLLPQLFKGLLEEADEVEADFAKPVDGE